MLVAVMVVVVAVVVLLFLVVVLVITITVMTSGHEGSYRMKAVCLVIAIAPSLSFVSISTIRNDFKGASDDVTRYVH